MRTHQQRLSTASKVQLYALSLMLGAGTLTLVMLLLVINEKPGHHNVHLIQALVVSVAVTLASYKMWQFLSVRIAYHADRTFLASLFRSNGFGQSEAERLASIKAKNER